MLRLLVACLTCTGLVLVTGCSNDAMNPEATTPNAHVAEAGIEQTAPATEQENNIYRFTDNAVIGKSMLVRTDNGVTLSIKAHSLDPGSYTVWFIPFNDWENCATTPCGFADFVPETRWDAGYAAGVVVGSSGKMHVSGHLNEGDTATFFFGIGMEDARDVEMHAILRYHGPTLPGEVSEQIHTFNGGCNPDCFDVAGTNHLPQ